MTLCRNRGIRRRSPYGRCGHLLDYVGPDGRRGCLTCRRRQAAEAHARIKVRRALEPPRYEPCAGGCGVQIIPFRGRRFCDDVVCRNQRLARITQAWRERHPDRLQASKERQSARRSALKRSDPEFRRRLLDGRLHWLSVKREGKVVRLRIKMSREIYDDMHANQGGLCAICGRAETALNRGVPKRLAIDHDHESGKVRALLCAACNIGIGLLGHSPERLEIAADYLRTHARAGEARKREAVERLGRAVS